MNGFFGFTRAMVCTEYLYWLVYLKISARRLWWRFRWYNRGRIMARYRHCTYVGFVFYIWSQKASWGLYER